MVTDTVGARAVRLARATLEAALPVEPPGPARGLDPPPADFEEQRGVFVTLRAYPSGTLRGCIGFPRAILPLGRAIREAARSAATEDPRFPPVEAKELVRITLEVSILTAATPLAGVPPGARLNEVKVGRDGLIVEGFGASGLLLPQVAPEQGWNAEQLLAGTSEKAGLPPDAWRDPRVRVLRFEAEVFAESSPGGDVVRVPTGV